MSAANEDYLILVTDDNAAGRYATCRILEAAGFRTVQSAGGAEALQLARQGVSAVVLDVHLPDLHGFEVCRLLRANADTLHLPVVHVSAVHVAPEDKVTGLAAGADAYYVSPVEPIVLVATLRALIRSREMAEGMRHSQRRYRGLFDEAPVGMALIDGDGCIVDANEAFSRLVQWPRETLLGKPLGSLVPADRSDAFEQTLAGWSRRPWSGPLTVLTPSGVPVPLAWASSPHAEPGYSIAVAQPHAAMA